MAVKTATPKGAQTSLDDESSAGASLAPDVVASVWTKLGDGGRVVIPAEIRRMLGIKAGDPVLLCVEDGELHLLTPEQGWERAQSIVRRFVPAGVSLVDELIAERRAEAARE